MNILNLCGPVVLYLGFSLIQIIIDIFREHFNVALLKFIVMIVFATVLNILCSQNLTIVAWLIVFIPFIFMTVITTLLLIAFGLDPKLGKIKIPESNNNVRKMGKTIGREIADTLPNKYPEHSNSKLHKHHHHHHHNDNKNIGRDPDSWTPNMNNLGGGVSNYN
jgi:predicted membrane protein